MPRAKPIKNEAAATWVPTGDLTPWEDNPRRNDGRPVEAVMDSIKRFGFAAPILARQEDGQVIAGHTRLKAALALGLDKVPVRYLDLDPADAALLALADNRLGELADWDDEALARIVADLDSEDLALAGWDETEAVALLADEEAPDFDAALETDDARDDELPEEVEPLTKPGDLIELGDHFLHCGDCIEVMKGMEDNSIDAIVTDPPYGLSPDGKARTWDDLEDGKARGGFMGKGWDAAVPGVTWARECLRVLKPGGHIVAFGGQRTIHRLTCSLEDAGFSIRELFGWLNWQGFPKSLDASKALEKAAGVEPIGERKPTLGMANNPQWNTLNRQLIMPPTQTEDARTWSGFGSGLKPCLEPAIIARKPLIGTVAENLLEWGTGALNIDGCRYAYGDEAWPGPQEPRSASSWARGTVAEGYAGGLGPTTGTADPLGRWPANVYACPKASRGEREAGCEELTPKRREDVTGRKEGSAGQQHARSGMTRTGDIGNHHPTVKPSKLMRWLVRLVGCQPGSTVLDPFAGSGTTLLAAEREGFVCIGIEREPAYCDIARARLTSVLGD